MASSIPETYTTILEISLQKYFTNASRMSPILLQMPHILLQDLLQQILQQVVQIASKILQISFNGFIQKYSMVCLTYLAMYLGQESNLFQLVSKAFSKIYKIQYRSYPTFCLRLSQVKFLIIKIFIIDTFYCSKRGYQDLLPRGYFNGFQFCLNEAYSTGLQVFNKIFINASNKVFYECSKNVFSYNNKFHSSNHLLVSNLQFSSS